MFHRYAGISTNVPPLRDIVAATQLEKETADHETRHSSHSTGGVRAGRGRSDHDNQGFPSADLLAVSASPDRRLEPINPHRAGTQASPARRAPEILRLFASSDEEDMHV